MIKSLISYIFELKALSLSTLKFIFATLIFSLLLKINDVDSNLIEFLFKFFWNLNIFKKLFYDNVLYNYKNQCGDVENLIFIYNFFE